MIFRRCKCIYNRGENSIDINLTKKLLNEGALLIDVRSPQEYNEGNLQGSINIPLYEFNNIEDKIPDKNSIIVLYCEYGGRSNKARKILINKRYVNVYTLLGGLNSI